MTDHPPDSRWMTYAEAAGLLGVDPESVKRRAQRVGWPRMPGNDGRTRVAIPAAALAPLSSGQSPPAVTPPSLAAELAAARRQVAVLRTAMGMALAFLPLFQAARVKRWLAKALREADS